MSRRAKTPGGEKTDLWMPLWIGDYLADTMSLSTAQHGAYLLLLMAYWRNRGPLKNDDEDLRGVARADAADWPALREKVLQRFFSLVHPDGDVTCDVTCNVTSHVWRHKRADEELAVARSNQTAAVARTAKATAARLAKYGPDAGEKGSGAPPIPPAPPPPDDARDESRNVQRNVQRNVVEKSNVTLSPSPSPSPSPNPSGSSSVAKATGAPSGAVKPPLPPPPKPPGPSARQPVPVGPPDTRPVLVRAAENLDLSRTDEERRKQLLWRAGKLLLEEIDGVSRRNSGGILAKLHGQYEAVFLDAVEATAGAGKPGGSYVEYLTATCQHLAGERERVGNKNALLEAGADATAAAWVAKKKGEVTS